MVHPSGCSASWEHDSASWEPDSASWEPELKLLWKQVSLAAPVRKKSVLFLHLAPDFLSALEDLLQPTHCLTGARE